MMKAGCAMDILFKPRVEATEQMAQNCMHGHFAPQESKRAQNRIQVACIITVCSSYCTSENMTKKCLKCSFLSNLDWILTGKYLSRYFLLISR